MLAGLAAATLALPAAAVTIDSFTTNQAAVTDPPGGSTVVTGGADIIGTRRNLTSDLLTLPTGTSGTGPVSGSVAAGALSVSVANTTPDSRGEVYATWDGDATAGNLNPTGLAGADLTAGNTHNALRIRVNSASAGTEIVVDVHTSATASSRGFLRIPVAIAAPTDLFLTYKYDFVPTAASPATFSNVGAIEMRVRGTEITAAIDIVDTTGPSLSTNTKRDLDLANSPIVTPVLEGSTFKYRVTLGASSGLAEDVDLTDTVDLNTTLDAASVQATPVAIDDAYRTAGHVGLTIAAPGLLTNDFDPDANGSAPELVVAPASVGIFATTLGGSITIAADGSFTYEPPVDFHRTIDTFTYTLQDNDGQTATALVKVAIGRRVWFVDDVHGGTNSGTRDNPFVTFTGTNVNGAGGAGDRDAEGDIIFMYSGGHNAQVELEAGEWLIGEGEGLLVDGQQIVAPGTDPTVTSAAHGIVLATNNTLRGFTVGATGASSFDIFGSAFGTLTLSNVVLNGAGGGASLTTGTLAAEFESVASTSGTHGLNLDTVSGTFGVTGALSLSNSSFGLRINASPTLVTTFGSTGSFTTSAGSAVFASNGGTINFAGTSNTANATNGAAVALASTSLGAGATFSTVSATTNASVGLALDNVTGSFTGSGGAISITGGTGYGVDLNAGSNAISYAGTVSGPRIAEITSRTGGTVTLSGNLTGSAGPNISVSGNSGGTTTFSGSTKTLNAGASTAVSLTSNSGHTINFTGGNLDIDTTSGVGFNATGGAAAVTVQGTVNTITSTTGTALNVANTTIGSAGLTFQSIASNGASSGIVLSATGSTGGLTVTGTGAAGSGGTIQSSTSHGILLSNTMNVSLSRMIVQASGDDGVFGTTVNGFTLANSSVINNGNAAADDGIYLVDPVGAITLTNVTATGNAHNNAWIYDSNNTGGNSTLTLSGGSYSSTANANGNHGLLLDILGTAVLGTSTISGATFSNNKVIGMQVLTGDSSTMSDLTISGNTFQDTGTGNSQEISMDVSKAGTSNMTVKVLNNTNITGHNSHGMNFFTAAGAGTTGTYNVRISGNTIGNAAVAGSGSLIGNCMRVNINGDADASVLIDGNVLRQCPNGRGIEVIGRNGTGGLDVTVTNNDVNTNDVSGFPLCAILVQSNDVTIPNTVRSDVRGNTVLAGTAFDVVTTFIGVVETGTSTSQLVDTAPASASCTAQLTSTNTGSASASAGCSLIAGPITTPP
jgi:hypothetical protein